MTRRQAVATVVTIIMVASCAAAVFRRAELLELYYRHRLTAEIDAWRDPPMTTNEDGLEVRDYTDYSRVDAVLSKLVTMDAIDRVELQFRLYTDGATKPLPSLDRLRNGSDPKPIFFHIQGNPRVQPQTVVIWCEHNETDKWQRFAARSLNAAEQEGR